MGKWRIKGPTTRLNNIFVRDVPTLPDAARLAIAAWLPMFTLILAPLAFLQAWGVWHWAQAERVDTLHGVCNAYSVSGCGNAAAIEQFSWWLWGGIGISCLQGLAYLLAYRGLARRRRGGWRWMYLAALLNPLFVIDSALSGFGSIITLRFWSGIAGALIAFYLLFQIRELYPTKRQLAATAPAAQTSKTNGRGDGNTL